MIAEQAKAAK